MTPEQIEIPPTELDRIRTDAIKWKREEWRRMNKNITDIYIDAAKAEYLHRLSIPPSDTGARWVDAFAVMPGNDWEGHIKYADCGAEAGKFGNKADLEDLIEYEKDHPVMWLDESAPAPLQDKGIR